MKKAKNNIFIGILFITLTAFFSSCNNDDSYISEKRWVALATVKPLADSTSYYLTLDNGTTLLPIAMGNYTPKNGQRVFLNFTYLADSETNYDYAIKINGIANILTKSVESISTPEDEDAFGDDPIKVYSVWIGDGYLNFHFAFKGQNKTHRISLVYDSRIDYGDNMIHLLLKHNAYDDNPYHNNEGYVAFDIHHYLENLQEGKTRTFAIHTKVSDNTDNVFYIKYEQ